MGNDLQPLNTFQKVPIYPLLSQKDFKHHSISYMLTVSLIYIFVTILDVELLETYVRNQTNDDS